MVWVMEFTTKYEGPHCDVKDLVILPVGQWRHQRPVTKIEKCAHCGCCYLVCPTGCIVDNTYYFSANLEFCKGCGVCATECPSDAIHMVREETA